jgi:hypothetical protein
MYETGIMQFIVWIGLALFITSFYSSIRSSGRKEISDGEKFFAFLMIFAVIGYLYSLTF